MYGDSAGYIAALDVGTTTLRCQIFNKKADCIGSAYDKIKIQYPNENCVEINPDELWEGVVNIVNGAILDANISVHDVKSLGISTQRATFITWRKQDGKPLQNFITWKDLRAWEFIQNVNQSWKVWLLRMGCFFAHLVTRQLKFDIVSNLKFTSAQVTLRLLWMLQNHHEIRDALSNKDIMFGTVDTWLVYKLTGGKTYVTDVSNASATGMYDPFSLCWSFIPKYLNIPDHIFPLVVDNNYEFGQTLGHIFGASIKIGALMSDQSASMYGSSSFNENDLKITLGTGAFLDVNTGTSIQASSDGIYPLVGWKNQRELVYFTEVPVWDAGSLVEWMLATGLISNPNESGTIASNAKSNGGVYFIPAFSGLGPPINNESAASGFIGIKPNTRKEHIVRAVLESIVFKTAIAYEMLKEQCQRTFNCIRVDGGVSKNDFICQLLADITNVPVKRLSAEMSALGVAYLAGLSCGMWDSRGEIAEINKVDVTFQPSQDEEKIQRILVELRNWKKAAERFVSWYD